ncbi:hypothetical protein [Haladaptatus sp. NG-SE-30]
MKVGFSRWAVTDSYRYRGGYDVTFPLSDHCDFDDLDAVPLKQDQTSLSEFVWVGMVVTRNEQTDSY